MPKSVKTSKKRGVSRPKPRSASSRKTPAASRAKVVKRRGVIHHGKRLYRATPKFIHGMVVGAIIGILIISQFGASQGAAALAIATSKDCDSYSIINCGITSTKNLNNSYDNSAYVRHVYKHFNISAADIDAMGNTAVQGTVFRNGEVKVNGKLVAKTAFTAARLRVTSQDKRVVVSGSTFYTRKLSTSWSHASAPAYVVMKNGVFQFAIIASCGNPIIATPVKPPSPPPTPAAIASLSCVSLGYNNKGLAYTFVVRATAKNTKIKSYSFYLSDRKSPVVVKTSATKASIGYKFTKYSARYSAYVRVSSDKITTSKSSACSKTFTTPAISECKPGVPLGSPECNECTPTNDSGDDACKPPTKIVTAAKITSLPNTGPGAILFVFAIALVCGTLFHRTHHHIKKRRAARHSTHHAHHAR